MATKMRADFTVLTTGRTVEEKLGGIVNCIDYGADQAASASTNTAAINDAIVAAAAVSSGYVIVPVGIAYTEGSIVFDADVILMEFQADGRIVFISSDTGDSPLSKSGIGIKQQGTTGILLRAVDFGVAGEPFLQVVDLANGDVAATHTRFVELDEITPPANPSANKARLYVQDNGAGKTQIVVQFPTGAVQVLATEP